jgi:hypothetical protein
MVIIIHDSLETYAEDSRLAAKVAVNIPAEV